LSKNLAYTRQHLSSPPNCAHPRLVTLRLADVLAAYADAFDARAYWDAHEHLEGWWRGDRRDLWQALIQLAAAFVHIDGGRLDGAARVLQRAVARLDAEPETAFGIDVDGIRRRAHALLEHLERTDTFDEAFRFRMTPLLGR
jgi:hypothetical protein